MNQQNHLEIKVILVGNSGVGKTNLINILIGQKFQSVALTTSASAYVEKEITIDNNKYYLEIWDTAGQEKFNALTKVFIKESKIVIFVYDITSKQSFDDIKFWVNMVKEVLDDNVIFGLAGNKKDLFLNENVTEEEGIQKAKELGAIFKLTSAKTGHGINELMEKLLIELIKEIKAGKFEELKIAYKLDNKKGKGKKKCCK